MAVSLRQMMERVANEPKLKFIIPGIKEGSVGIVFGPSKSGKTMFCENLAMAIASGQASFFGMPINITNRKVLIISFEEYYTNRTERNALQVSKLTPTCGEDWIDNYMVVDEDMPTYISTEVHWQKVADVIAESGASVVILDSVTRMSENIEESANAQVFTRKLRALSQKTGTTLIAIHHTTKMYGQAISIDNIAGSRVIAQELDFMIGINRTMDGKCYLKNVAFRYAPCDSDLVTTFTIDDTCWLNVTGRKNETKVLAANDGRRDDTKSRLIYEYMKEQLSVGKEIVNTKEIYATFVDTKMMSKPIMYEHLENLVDDRLLVKCGKAEYKLAA
jgi:archaellum biogenesis ATPase FlaH